MVSERIDSVNKYFQTVSKVNTSNGFLFWISVIISFAIFFTSDLKIVHNVLNIIFIVIVVANFIVGNWLSLFLLREAQSRRRIHLLSDSLGVSLDDEQTNLYYNNSYEPSLIRLGVNVFENTLFTWKVSKKMLIKKRIQIFFYFLILIILILIRGTNLDFIAIVAQTIFTTGLIVDYLKLEILRYSCSHLFENFRQIFLMNNISQINPQLNAIILNLVFKYETTIASMGIQLSNEIFKEINSEVTSEWETVKNNLNL